MRCPAPLFLETFPTSFHLEQNLPGDFLATACDSSEVNLYFLEVQMQSLGRESGGNE